MKIGITGSNGFIGWHLRAFLKGKDEVEVITVSTSDFEGNGLEKFALESEFIIHLAGVNRGEEDEVYNSNVNMTKKLIEACDAVGSAPHIIFSSSIHCNKDTAYGKSKRKCAEMLEEWVTNSINGRFSNLILPNVFGEFGIPFYNSVVSTFCYQVANDKESEITNDVTTNQIYAQEVASQIYDIILNDEEGSEEYKIEGNEITVSEILAKLNEFKDCYDKHEVPNVNNKFDLQLFNTYRSYKYPDNCRSTFFLYEDDRGYLFEAAKCSSGGQVFFSTTKPSITRGNHYHTRKVERFVVIDGKAEINIRKILSNETNAFIVNGEDHQYIDMPTFCTHNVKNIGDTDLLMLFWCNEVFNPNDADTFYEEV